jgi:hypothetical protein
VGLEPVVVAFYQAIWHEISAYENIPWTKTIVSQASQKARREKRSAGDVTKVLWIQTIKN